VTLKVSESSIQIPLDFKSNKVKTFNDFVTGNNGLLIDSLHSFSQSDESLFYLWGESGSGKSHILQAYINRLSLLDITAAVIVPEELENRKNVSMIEMFDYICIDSIEHIAGNSLLEEALFFWINEIRQAKKKIIIAGTFSNKNATWRLPDLCSRLKSGRTYELKPLGREEVLNVFKKIAQQKGIMIDERVIGFLEKNCPMNLSFLSDLLDNLDKITLAEKKQATIPLLKKILNTKLVN